MKENDEMKTFCENILYLRQKNNLSYTKMARKLHITVKTLKTLEEGNIPRF